MSDSFSGGASEYKSRASGTDRSRKLKRGSTWYKSSFSGSGGGGNCVSLP